ncbi:MAG: adenylosuccinate lyase [Flavobacteriaceae bacterium]|nr:adenylosuccinate lyase [Flavobacteriaceae bacterium]
MDIHFLTAALHQVENAKRENRERVANIVLDNQELFPHLITITFKTDDKLSIRAAWILEWICTHNDLNLITPHLEEFTENIANLTYDSAIRPCAKICEQIAKAYTSKNEHQIKEHLTEIQIDRIVTTGFDWLITPQKIAVRAYTMEALFLFGLQKTWIHPELQHIISTKNINESAGCRARGKKILSWIKKQQKTLKTHSK